MPTAGPGPTTSPFLYLPIEVAARELDAKLLIAYFAVSAGYEVVFGQKWLMQRNLRRMPPGIVLFKTLTAVDAKLMLAARAEGHRIAAMDEEIPGLIARNEGLRWVTPAAVSACDIVFALGDEHLDALLWRFPEHRGKYSVVGNPRWDLLRPEFARSHDGDVERIRGRYGRFILINTNLGFTNSGKGTTEQMVRKLERGGKFDRRKPENAFFLSEHLRLERASLDGVGVMLPMLAVAFPDHNIIVRPHPSENASTWRSIVAGTPRTEVVRHGAALHWILAADLLIHAYCTTGVEAFALGRPAICFRPTDSFVLDNYLSPLINIPGRTVDDVVGQAAAIVRQGAGFAYPDEYRVRFDRSFAAQHGAFAAERIVQRLTEGLNVSPAPDAPRALWAPGRGYTRYVLSKKHNRGLMPPLTPADLRQRLERYDEVIGRRQRFVIEPCGDRVFHIHGHAESAVDGAWLPRWVRRLAGGASAGG